MPLTPQRWEFKLASPLPLKQGLLTHRRGLYLSLNGQTGEVAPFEGLSTETLEGVFQYCQNLPTDLDSLVALSKEPGCPASLGFALAMLCHPLSEIAASPLKLNALFLNRGDIISDIASAYAKGYRTFKLKLGFQSLSQDLNLVHHLYKAYGNQIQLRLDLNRSWDLQTLKSFWEQAPLGGLEYFEEPCLKTIGLQNIPRGYLALDETLQEMDFEALKSRDLSEHPLILKPMILGWPKTLYLLQNYGTQCILSSTFESPVGWGYLVRLAVKYNPEGTHGLDTWRVWPWANESLLQEGKLVIQGLFEHRIFDVKL